MTQPTHIVQIPSSLPSPYNTFSESWRDWVNQINGQSVSIMRFQAGMSTATASGIQIIKGHEIQSSVKPEPGSSTSMWLPPEWLKPLNGLSCTCDPRDLFNFGCRGH